MSLWQIPGPGGPGPLHLPGPLRRGLSPQWSSPSREVTPPTSQPQSRAWGKPQSAEGQGLAQVIPGSLQPQQPRILEYSSGPSGRSGGADGGNDPRGPRCSLQEPTVIRKGSATGAVVSVRITDSPPEADFESERQAFSDLLRVAGAHRSAGQPGPALTSHVSLAGRLPHSAQASCLLTP